MKNTKISKKKNIYLSIILFFIFCRFLYIMVLDSLEKNEIK